jgi:hypothetical protein
MPGVSARPGGVAVTACTPLGQLAASVRSVRLPQATVSAHGSFYGAEGIANGSVTLNRVRVRRSDDHFLDPVKSSSVDRSLTCFRSMPCQRKRQQQARMMRLLGIGKHRTAEKHQILVRSDAAGVSTTHVRRCTRVTRPCGSSLHQQLHPLEVAATAPRFDSHGTLSCFRCSCLGIFLRARFLRCTGSTFEVQQ